MPDPIAMWKNQYFILNRNIEDEAGMVDPDATAKCLRLEDAIMA
jgi:hypothetical protein